MIKTTVITAADMQSWLTYLQGGGFAILAERVQEVINNQGPHYVLWDEETCCPQWPYLCDAECANEARNRGYFDTPQPPEEMSRK